MKTYLILAFILFSCSSNKRVPSSQSGLLFIGDSQTAGNLGKFSYEYLTTKFDSSELEVYGVGGSSPRHWSSDQKAKDGKWLCSQKGRVNGNINVSMKKNICSGPEEQMIYSYLNRKKADFVVFQFLGNSMGFSQEFIKSNVDKLLSELGNQDCLFITSPPYYYELSEKNKLRKTTEDYLIKAIDNRCIVYAGMTDENLKVFAYDRENYLSDRIHLSLKGAQTFFEQFKSMLP